MPQAKYRLHAKKVDRIAIVDRPAVPDAEILLFKRNGNVLTKEVLINKLANEYAEGLAYYTIDGAVSALQNGFWATFYDDDVATEDKAASFDSLFNKFEESVFSLIALSDQINKQEQEAPSAEEVVASFKNGMATSAIYDAFELFRSHLTWFAINAKSIPTAQDIIKGVIQEFKSFVLKSSLDITKNYSAEKIQLEKEGRIISSARLAKLKEALKFLDELISEAEARLKDKTKKEDGMTEQEKAQAEATAKAAELAKSEAEAKAKAEAEAKAKAEAMTPEQLDAAVKSLNDTYAAVKTEVSALAERIKALEEANKALKADAEKAVAEKAELVKAFEDFKTSIAKSAEVEKSEKTDVSTRLEAAEKALNEILKGFENLGKRMGLSTALPIESLGKKEEVKTDVFANALKGDKKK